MRSRITWVLVLTLALLVVFPAWVLGRYRPVEGPMFPRPADSAEAPHRPQLWQEVAQVGHGPVWWALTYEQKGEEPCRLIAERTLLDIPKWSMLRFGVSPDGRRLVVAESPPQGVEGTRLTFWDTVALGAPKHELSHAMTVHSMPLFPDGGRFLQIEGEFVPESRWEYSCITRSASTGEVLERSDPFPDDPDEMILSPDGLTVACRTRATIRIYPATGGWADVPTIQNDCKQHFTGIAIHPSGRFLAATSNDKTMKLYDAGSGKLARGYDWDIGRMRSIAFSPDGLLAAAGSDTGKVVVWDVDV